MLFQIKSAIVLCLIIPIDFIWAQYDEETTEYYDESSESIAKKAICKNYDDYENVELENGNNNGEPACIICNFLKTYPYSKYNRRSGGSVVSGGVGRRSSSIYNVGNWNNGIGSRSGGGGHADNGGRGDRGRGGGRRGSDNFGVLSVGIGHGGRGSRSGSGRNGGWRGGSGGSSNSDTEDLGSSRRGYNSNHKRGHGKFWKHFLNAYDDNSNDENSYDENSYGEVDTTNNNNFFTRYSNTFGNDNYNKGYAIVENTLPSGISRRNSFGNCRGGGCNMRKYFNSYLTVSSSAPTSTIQRCLLSAMNTPYY